MSHRALLLAGTLLLLVSATAQETPLKGVVWSVPADIGRAEADLAVMRRMGVEAVRTEIILDGRILTHADSLGLVLFQDLPIEWLSATALRDTLDYALELLETAIERSADHPSARNFGLARLSDSSSPRGCGYFARLTERVRRLPRGRTYYVTAFVQDDLCSSEVDMVLIDVSAGSAPLDLLRRWRRRTPAGIADLGTGVAEASVGLLDPRSSESQARYLETQLSLLQNASESPDAIFVYRYRDSRPQAAKGFGLFAADGTSRPALDVVRGIFTGSQRVFAFVPGRPPPAPMPWNLLLGWVALGMLAACFALSGRYRDLLRRYFGRHGFYRDSVRSGREVRLSISVIVLAALALCAGVFGSMLLESVRHHAAVTYVIASLPHGVQQTVMDIMGRPWLLVLLLGLQHAFGLVLWAAAFSAFSRVPASGSLTIVAWTRWPLALLAFIALIVPSLPPRLSGTLLILLTGTWALVTCTAIVRTLLDFGAIASVRRGMLITMATLNPVTVPLLVGLLTLILWKDGIQGLEFFWHLATRN